MAELFLGCATFAHHTKENGYEIKIEKPKSRIFFLMTKGKMHFFPIYPDKTQNTCGFTYTNYDDLEAVFTKDPDFVNSLVALCNRPNPRLNLSNPHCSLDSPLWGKLKTVISSGETISCMRKAVRQ